MFFFFFSRPLAIDTVSFFHRFRPLWKLSISSAGASLEGSRGASILSLQRTSAGRKKWGSGAAGSVGGVVVFCFSFFCCFGFFLKCFEVFFCLFEVFIYGCFWVFLILVSFHGCFAVCLVFLSNGWWVSSSFWVGSHTFAFLGWHTNIFITDWAWFLW